jgi:hypothetical protein
MKYQISLSKPDLHKILVPRIVSNSNCGKMTHVGSTVILPEMDVDRILMSIRIRMGVFEPPATEIEASNRPASPSERPRSNTPATVASGSNGLPPGRARFIQHQTRQSVHPDNDEAPEGLPYLPRNEFMASSDHSEGDHSLECTADVVDDILRSVHNSTLLSSTGDNVQTKSSLIHRHA